MRDTSTMTIIADMCTECGETLHPTTRAQVNEWETAHDQQHDVTVVYRHSGFEDLVE